MKSRPILFSLDMVRAIREGRKTQTRRIVVPQPQKRGRWTEWTHKGVLITDQNVAWSPFDEGFPRAIASFQGADLARLCPYGTPGDLLWVRESFFQFGHWEPVNGVRTKGGRQKWRFVADRPGIRFAAPKNVRLGRHSADPQTPAWHKRLGRFMPRAMSRTKLRITGIRVELLQRISHADCVSEGIERLSGYDRPAWQHYGSKDAMTYNERKSYHSLWESINGAGSWDANPWVWVISFERIGKRAAAN